MIIDDFINVEKIDVGTRECTKFSIAEKNYLLLYNVLERLDSFADNIGSIEPRVNEAIGGGVMAGLLVEQVFVKYLNSINKFNDPHFAKTIQQKNNNIYFVLMKNNENIVFNLFFAADGDYNKIINTAKFPMRQNVKHNVGVVFKGNSKDVYDKIISFKELEFVAFTGFNQDVYATNGYKRNITQRGITKEVTLVDSQHVESFNTYLTNSLGDILKSL